MDTLDDVDWDERSSVEEAAEAGARKALASKPDSNPPKVKAVVALLNAKPSWSMVVLVGLLLLALIAGGSLRPAVDAFMGWAK